MTEIIRSRAPLRIGVAGGGTDVDPYATEKGGYVFNTTINRYAHCTLIPRSDKIMNVESRYYGRYTGLLGNRPFKLDGNMDLIKAVANHFEIKKGFDMVIHSDVPSGSGLGGSSTMIVAMISAIANWTGHNLSKYDMAKLAYCLEREDVGLAGGHQDQYAAVFGGFNYLEMGKDKIEVKPVKIHEDTINELQYRSVLCYTKTTRESANMIEAQKESTQKGTNEEALNASKVLAKEIGKALEKGDIDTAGRKLDDAWGYKKQFSDKVSNEQIDELYEIAKKNGAVGGKISGAGGGGFMYFICEYDKKPAVSEALKDAGGELTDFMFEPKGVTTWKYNN